MGAPRLVPSPASWARRAWGLAFSVLYGARGDGATDDRAALARMDATGGALYLAPGVYRIGSDLIISGRLQLAAGAILKPDAGVTLTVAGEIDATRSAHFDLSAGGVVDLKDPSPLPPQWFGAVADGATDDAPAMQSAVRCIQRNGLPGLDLTRGRYYLASPVLISAAQDFSIFGPRSGTLGSGDDRGLITGAPGLRCMFDYGEGQNLGITASFVADGIVADGYTGAASPAVVACIEVTTLFNGPARPFYVERCSMQDFGTAAVYVTANTNAALGQVVLERNTFRYNGAAFLSPAGRIMNFRFVGNLSEQGGRIEISGQGVSGACTVTDNMLEGQSNPVILAPALGNVLVERNYFEGCSGSQIISIDGDNAQSTVEIGPNHYLSTTAARKLVAGDVVLSIKPDSLLVGYSDVVLGRLHGNSRLGGRSFACTTGAVQGGGLGACLDPEGFAMRAAPTHYAATVALLNANTYPLAQTPWGGHYVRSRTANSGPYQPGMALAVGDVLVVCVLVRYSDAPDSGASSTGWARLLDLSDGTQRAEGTAGHSLLGPWCLHVFQLVSDRAITAANVDVEYNPYGSAAGVGAGADVAGVWIAKVDPAKPWVTPYFPEGI